MAQNGKFREIRRTAHGKNPSEIDWSRVTFIQRSVELRKAGEYWCVNRKGGKKGIAWKSAEFKAGPETTQG